MVATIEALIRVDRRKLAERFLRTLAYRAAEEDELLLVARLAAHNGFTAVAVNAARRASRGGAALIELGSPMLQAAPARPPAPAPVHATTRQAHELGRPQGRGRVR